MLQAKPAISVRQAKPRDIPRLVELETICFDGIYSEHRYSRSDFERAVEDRDYTLLLAESDARGIIGCAVGRKQNRKSGLTGDVISIAVDPSARGNGVGKRLLRALLGRLSRQGCGRKVAEVAESNEPSRRLIRGAGFAPERRLNDYYGKGNHAVRMALNPVRD